MRNDLDKIIAEAKRSQGDSWKSYRYKYKSKNDIENSYYWNEEFESKGRYNRSINNRIPPLLRYLKSKIGHSWDDIWKEVCQLFDNRSFKGYKLRDHVLHLVENTGTKNEYIKFWRTNGWYNFLYVDNYGILREKKAIPRKKRHIRDKTNKFIKKKGNYTYFLTDHGWFVTENNVVYNNYDTIFSDLYNPLFYTPKTIPKRDKYFVQMNYNKPFHITSDIKKIQKAEYIAFNYKQCNKNDIKANLHDE